MLWLCVHLPDFPLEICSRGSSADEALVIGAGEGREQRVVAANEGARRAGIRPGMCVGEAYVLSRMLRVKPRDPAAEAEALARLAAWSGCYTSSVSIAAPDALLLEVEGSRNLYGTLDRLIEHARARLNELGYTARLALAPTPLGATWLARAGEEARVTDHAALFGALAPLPLASLELDPRQEALLKGSGLTALIDCLRLPRDGIARRMGPSILDKLDRAFGRLPDPRPVFVPPDRFRARLELPAPAVTRETLLFPLHRLLLELAGFLAARGLGASALEITLRAPRSADTSLSLRLIMPSRDAHYLTGLVRERLERMTLNAAVEEVALSTDALSPLAAQPLDFFAGAKTADEMRAQILDQLRARLGREAVQGLATCPDHRPERAWRWVEPGARGGVSRRRHRPVWLLSEPRALEVRGGQPYWAGALELEPEPERVESGWWDGVDIARDYFIARHSDGRQFWVFRELKTKQWFLHGVFG